MFEDTVTGIQFEVPAELLNVPKARSAPRDEGLRVEGWRTSWLSRLTEMLIGKD
jgi:hypothetical protein